MTGVQKDDHQFHIRIPAEVFSRIKAKADRAGRPINRIIIEELLNYPNLEKIAKLMDTKK
jgi:predicted HicB family RNase H-like nuclease